MPPTSLTPRRRAGATAVHSLHRFAFSVPDLDRAQDFYEAFGLDVRRSEGRIDLYAHGNPHRWASIHRGTGAKKLEYVSLAAFPEDYDKLVAGIERMGIGTAPHRLAEETGTWFRDPDGNAVQLVVGDKASPAEKTQATAAASVPEGKGKAPGRSSVQRVQPRRLSHILLFSTDVSRSVRFYKDALGLRLSDHSGDIIAFMHGAHASDHHMVAFAKSDGPGLHHSSWDVGSFDDVGLGMQQMIDRGYPDGWGVGRHVIGSNYFRYVRDPWGSFAEYSYDIDFIPADVDWPAGDHDPADSFYVWGPPVPDYFIVNHETAARAPTGA